MWKTDQSLPDAHYTKQEVSRQIEKDALYNPFIFVHFQIRARSVHSRVQSGFIPYFTGYHHPY